MAGGPTGSSMASRPTVQATDRAQEPRWDAIERKLAANAERLADQGGLVAMKSASGRRVWVVRFVDVVDGRKVHRSVYLGGDDQPELLERARGELQKYRARACWPDEVASYAQLAAAASGVVRRTLGIQPRIRGRTLVRYRPQRRISGG